jgi:hypothetical protein
VTIENWFNKKHWTEKDGGCDSSYYIYQPSNKQSQSIVYIEVGILLTSNIQIPVHVIIVLERMLDSLSCKVLLSVKDITI